MESRGEVSYNMKLKLILLFMIICVSSWLQSITYHIKQDGTGNFTTIQEGINTSMNSDTILVYPGTYYENIDFLEKSLAVTSLYSIVQEDSIIYQTIIDGNDNLRCITIDECDTIALIGFTIQNGKAMSDDSSSLQMGGGIYLNEVTTSQISNCRIINNKAYTGGGILIYHASPLLENNIVSNNWGIRFGGGIAICGNDSYVQFSENNLNSIYYNFSSTGSDISLTEAVPFTDIYLDTLTVMEPDFFFVNPSHKYSITVQNAKITEVDQDLYISPDGSDSNGGLTPDDPLQTLWWAQTLIKRNDENPNTIFLASGIYSMSSNNQKFPINIKHGTTYSGETYETTILDAEDETTLIFFHSHEDIFPSIKINNLAFINGYELPVFSEGVIDIYLRADLKLENVYISNFSGSSSSVVSCRDGYFKFKNVTIENNSGSYAVYLNANYNYPSCIMNATFENCIIRNNSPSTISSSGFGGSIYLGGHPELAGDYYAKLVNCEITGNFNNFYNPQHNVGGASGINANDHVLVDVVNCTFGENSVAVTTGSTISLDNAVMNFINSIVYSNDGYTFSFWDDCELNISHSLIEDDTINVGYYGNGNGVLNWQNGNLNEDPLWLETGDYPYYLQSNSPCIDSGTLDLPLGIELPQYDLAGNPRIYGDTIDMGAYEWQGTGVEEPEIPQFSPFKTQISSYPNPFNPSTTIKLELAEAGKIELSIYNIKGQKVKTLLNCLTAPGTYKCNWNGKDDTGKAVSSGQYLVKLKQNGKETMSKIMLLK